MYIMAIFSALMFVAGAVLTYLAMSKHTKQIVDLEVKAKAPVAKMPTYVPVRPSRPADVEYEEDDD